MKNSIAIGYQALLTQNYTSSDDAGNMAIGRLAGGSITTTATHNTLLGYQSGDALTTDYNVALGDRMLYRQKHKVREIQLLYLLR